MQSAVATQPDLQLLSDTPGRQRWMVPAIQGRPRLAAALQAALRREAGITGSEVNPVTGRVLLRWNPEAPEPAADEVFARVLFTGPLNDDEWMTVEAQRKEGRKARGLVT